MLILLYSVLTLVITVVVFAIYITNIKDAYRHQIMKANGQKPTSFKYDMNQFLDGKYHITLMSFPVLMIGIFNVLPLIFMILIAFTNYDKQHMPPGTLFTWIGFDNFGSLFNLVEGAKKGYTFIKPHRMDSYLGCCSYILKLYPWYDLRSYDQQEGYQV